MDESTVAAFANAVTKEGGSFELTKSGELALRYPDGKLVIFEGSSEIPSFAMPANVEAFNEDASKLIEIFENFVKADDATPVESNSHFNSGINSEIAPTQDTGTKVPVGDKLEYLPGQHPEAYKFALDLDNLFAFYETNEITTPVGLSLSHLPGLLDEDYLRGQDPRDRLG